MGNCNCRYGLIDEEFEAGKSTPVQQTNSQLNYAHGFGTVISDGNEKYGSEKIIPTSSNNKNLETSDVKPKTTSNKQDRLYQLKNKLSIDTEI